MRVEIDNAALAVERTGADGSSELDTLFRRRCLEVAPGADRARRRDRRPKKQDVAIGGLDGAVKRKGISRAVSSCLEIPASSNGLCGDVVTPEVNVITSRGSNRAAERYIAICSGSCDVACGGDDASNVDAIGVEIDVLPATRCDFPSHSEGIRTSDADTASGRYYVAGDCAVCRQNDTDAAGLVVSLTFRTACVGWCRTPKAKNAPSASPPMYLPIPRRMT